MFSKTLSERKLVLGLSGASGAIYAQKLLRELAKICQPEQVAVVCSKNAKLVWRCELDLEVEQELSRLGFVSYAIDDYSAPFASGSARFDTMFIVPCSMGTLARIAQGLSNDLLSRAADVILKEKRRLILVPRESPYNSLHLRNMQSLSDLGAIIAPASPHFYAKPQDLDSLIQGFIHRLLDLAELPESTEAYRWGS